MHFWHLEHMKRTLRTLTLTVQSRSCLFGSRMHTCRFCVARIFTKASVYLRPSYVLLLSSHGLTKTSQPSFPLPDDFWLLLWSTEKHIILTLLGLQLQNVLHFCFIIESSWLSKPLLLFMSYCFSCNVVYALPRIITEVLGCWWTCSKGKQ